MGRLQGFAMLGVFLCACGAGPARPPGSFEPPAYDLSREGFLDELVHPRGTPRTPWFGAAGVESYRFDREDLLEGLRERLEDRPHILGVAVEGPLADGGAHAITLYVMGHHHYHAHQLYLRQGRIVIKQTTHLHEGEYEELLQALEENPRFRPGDGPPVPPAGAVTGRYPAEILLKDWSTGRERTWRGIWYEDDGLEQDLDPYLEKVDPIVKHMTVTYSTDLEPQASIFAR